jgi:hypothetical protein
MAFGSTEPVTEMSTRNPRDNGRPTRKDDVTAICESTV